MQIFYTPEVIIFILHKKDHDRNLGTYSSASDQNFNSLPVSMPHAHKLQSYLVIWKWCRLFHMWLFLFIFQFTYMASCRFSKTPEQRLLYKQIKLHLNNISLSEQSLLFVKEQNIYTPSKSILHSSEIHFNVILCASFRYE